MLHPDRFTRFLNKILGIVEFSLVALLYFPNCLFCKGAKLIRHRTVFGFILLVKSNQPEEKEFFPIIISCRREYIEFGVLLVIGLFGNYFIVANIRYSISVERSIYTKRNSCDLPNPKPITRQLLLCTVNGTNGFKVRRDH